MTNNMCPKWLSKSYFQEVLQKSYGENAEEVKNVVIQPAVAAGNNVAGLLLRATVHTDKNKEISFVVKTSVLDPETAKMLEHVHEREMKMYEQVLPRIQELLYSIGETTLIGPKAFHVDRINKAIVMQDLKKDKYTVADRKVGLDWNHMKIVVQKHALLHACSMLLMEEGEDFERFQKGYFNEEDREQDGFMTRSFIELGSEVKKWEGYEKYGEKLIKLSKDAVAQAVEAYKRKFNQTCVLNHGDSWTNNFMFKYDEEGDVEDVCLVDFQYSNVASPISDLCYFFYTSANDEVKFNPFKFNELLQHYHQHLTTILTKLKSKTNPPTLFQLHQEFYQRSFIIISSSVIFAVLINESTQDTDIQTLIGDNELSKEFRRKMYNNQDTSRQ